MKIKSLGFSLIEIMLVLIIASSLIALSILGVQKYNNMADVNIDEKKIDLIKKEILQMHSSRKAYTGLNVASFIAGANLPNNFVMNNELGQPLSLEVSTVNKTNDTFIIKISNTSSRYCAGILSEVVKDFTAVRINATLIPRVGNVFDMSAIAAACGALPNQNMELIYTRVPELCKQEINWGSFPTDNNCKAKNIGGLSHGQVKAFTATNPMVGNVQMRCDDGVLVPLAGSTCAALACPTKQLSWKVPTAYVNKNTGAPESVDVVCTGPVTAAPSNYPSFVTRGVTANGGSAGASSYRCEFGVWRELPGSTCSGYCSKQAVANWTDTSSGITCDGSIPRTQFDSGVTFNSNGIDATGNGRAYCNPFTGSFSEIEGNCRQICVPGDEVYWIDPESRLTCGRSITDVMNHNTTVDGLKDNLTGPNQRGSANIRCSGGKLYADSGKVCGYVPPSFNLTPVTWPKWGSFANTYGVWIARGFDTYAGVFRFFVEFPVDGSYTFGYVTDNYGNLYVDDKYITSTPYDSFRRNPVYVTKYITKGYHVVRAEVVNAGVVGELALTITGPGLNWNSRSPEPFRGYMGRVP